MERNYVRPQSGSKAVAIDNRAQIAKIRLLLLLSILACTAMALVLALVVNH